MEAARFSILLNSNVFLMIIAPCFCYRYEVFENFEWSQMTFATEQKIVHTSLKIQEYLRCQKKHIQNLRDNTLHSKTRGFRKSWLLSSTYKHISRNIYSEYFNMDNRTDPVIIKERVHEMPMQEVIESAARGVVTLYEVYHSNISSYRKGYLGLMNIKEGKRRMADSLGIDDLILMSYVSMNHLNWYDTGMKYLKNALDIHNSFQLQGQVKTFDRLQHTLSLMKRYYPILHNNVLRLNHNPIGPGWKSFPFEVSPGKHATSWSYSIYCQ